MTQDPNNQVPNEEWDDAAIEEYGRQMTQTMAARPGGGMGPESVARAGSERQLMSAGDGGGFDVAKYLRDNQTWYEVAGSFLGRAVVGIPRAGLETVGALWDIAAGAEQMTTGVAQDVVFRGKSFGDAWEGRNFFRPSGQSLSKDAIVAPTPTAMLDLAARGLEALDVDPHMADWVRNPFRKSGEEISEATEQYMPIYDDPNDASVWQWSKVLKGAAELPGMVAPMVVSGGVGGVARAGAMGMIKAGARQAAKKAAFARLTGQGTKLMGEFAYHTAPAVIEAASEGYLAATDVFEGSVREQMKNAGLDAQNPDEVRKFLDTPSEGLTRAHHAAQFTFAMSTAVGFALNQTMYSPGKFFSDRGSLMDMNVVWRSLDASGKYNAEIAKKLGRERFLKTGALNYGLEMGQEALEEGAFEGIQGVGSAYGTTNLSWSEAAEAGIRWDEIGFAAAMGALGGGVMKGAMDAMVNRGAYTFLGGKYMSAAAEKAASIGMPGAKTAAASLGAWAKKSTGAGSQLKAYQERLAGLGASLEDLNSVMTHVSDAATVAHLDKLYASGTPAPYKPAGAYVSDLAAVAAANGREDFMLEAIADLKMRAKEGGGVPNRNAPFAAGQRQMAQTLHADKAVSEEVGLMEKRLKDAKRLKNGADWRARLAQDDKAEFGRYLREKWETDDIGRDLFRATQQLAQTSELMDATGRRFVGEQLGKTGAMETLGTALSELTKAGLLGQREVTATGPDGMPTVDASGNPVRRMTTPDENYNTVLGQIHKDMAAVAAGGEPSGETAKAIADGAVPGYDLEAYKKDLKTTADTMAGEPLGDDSVVEGLAATHADLAEMNRKRKQLEDLENAHKEAKRRLDEEWTEEKVKERAEKKASTVPPAAVAAAPSAAPAAPAAPAPSPASPTAVEAEETEPSADDPLEEAFRDVEPLPKTPPPPPSSEGWFSAVDTNLFGFTDAGSGRDPMEDFDGDSREAVSAALVRMSDNLLLLCGHNSGSEVEDGKTVHPKKRVVALPAGEHATSVRQKPDGTFEDTQKDRTPLPKDAEGPLVLYVETDKGVFRAVGFVNERIPVPKEGVTPAAIRESASKKGFAARLTAAPGSVFYVSFRPGEVGVNTPGAEGRTVAADTGVPTDSLSDDDLDALYEKASKGMYIVKYDRGWRGKLERAHAAVRHLAEGVREYVETVLPKQIGEDLKVSDLVGGVFVDLGGRMERLISSKPDGEAGWRTVLDRLDKTSDFLKDLTAWVVETSAATPSDKDPDAGKFTAFREALWGVLLGATNAPMVDHEGRLDFDVAYDDAGFTIRRGGDSHRVDFDWKSAALEAGETAAPDYGEKLRDGLAKALVAVTGFTLRTGINPTTLPSIGGFGTKYAAMDADRSSRTGLFSLVLGLTRTAMEGRDRIDGSRSFTFARPDAELMPKFAVEEPREVPKVVAEGFSSEDSAYVDPPDPLDAMLDRTSGAAKTATAEKPAPMEGTAARTEHDAVVDRAVSFVKRVAGDRVTSERDPGWKAVSDLGRMWYPFQEEISARRKAAEKAASEAKLALEEALTAYSRRTGKYVFVESYPTELAPWVMEAVRTRAELWVWEEARATAVELARFDLFSVRGLIVEGDAGAISSALRALEAAHERPPQSATEVEEVIRKRHADGSFYDYMSDRERTTLVNAGLLKSPAPATTVPTPATTGAVGTLFSSAEAPAEGDFGPADMAPPPVAGITYEVKNPLTGATETKTLDAIPGFVQGLTNYLARKFHSVVPHLVPTAAGSTAEVRKLLSDLMFELGEGPEDRRLADEYGQEVLTPIREKRAAARSGTAEYDRLLELETAHQAVIDVLRNAQPGNDAFAAVMREPWWEMLADEMERLHEAEELLDDQLAERSDGSEDPAEKDGEAPPELRGDPQWSSPEKKKLFQKARAVLNAAFRDTWVMRRNERGAWEEVQDRNGFPVSVPWTSVVAAVAQKMNAPDTRHEWETALAENAGPKTPALAILKNLYDRLMESPSEKDRLLASLLYTQTSLVPVQYVQVSMPSDLHKATKSFSANRGGNWLTRFFSWKTSVDKQKDDDLSSQRFANRVALSVRLAASGFTERAAETLNRLNLLVNTEDSVPQASDEEIRKTAVMVEDLYREYYGIELGADAVETLLREGHRTTLDFHAEGKPEAGSGHRFYKFADFMPNRTGGNSPSQMAGHLVMEVQRMTGYVQKLSDPDVFVSKGLEEVGTWASVQAFLGELSGFESKKGYQPIARIGVKTINAMMDRFYLHTRTKRAAQDKGKMSPMRTTMDRMKGRERDNTKVLETFSKLYGAMSSNPQKDENQTAHMTPREELTMRFDQLFQRMWTVGGRLTSHYMTPAASDSGAVFLLQGRFYGTMKPKGDGKRKTKGVLEALQEQALSELDRILAAGQVAKESAESGSVGLNLKGFDADVESDKAVRRSMGQVFVTFGFLNSHPKLAPFMTNGFLDPAKMGVATPEEDAAALEAAGEDPLAAVEALRGTLTGAVREAVEEHFASADRARYVLDGMVAAGLMQVDKSGNYRLRKTFPKINMYDPSNDREYTEFRDAWNKMFPDNGFLKVEGNRMTAVKVTDLGAGKKSFTETEIPPEENALLLWYLNDLANQVDFQERYADPAAFAKPDKGTYVADAASSLRKTFANYFKRLKGLVTPVKIGAWGNKKLVRIAVLADEEVDYDRVTYTDALGVQKMQLLPTEQAVALEKQLTALKAAGVEGIQVKRERHGKVNRTDAQAYNTPLSYYSNLVAAGELTAGRAFGMSMDDFRAAIAEERRNGTLVGGHTPLIDPRTGLVSTDDAVLARAFGDNAKDVKASLWYQMHSPVLEDGTHPAQDEAVSLKTAAFGPDAGVSLYASDKAERDRIVYLKCSETPLLPAFLPPTSDEAGTPIPNRYVSHLVRMYDDDVDVLAHTSAVKAGERFDQQVSEADPKWGPEKVLELDIRHYGIQMRTRTKRKKQISMGTQLMDLMRLNASSEGVKTALEEYRNLYVQLAANGHVRWMREWGLDPDTAVVADPVLFEKRRNDLARRAYKEGRISRNTYSAVLNGGLDVRYLPADFGSVMAAEYDKMAVQPKLPGTGLVQISDKLYEGYPGAENLQAPALVTNPDGTTYMQPGQALVGWPWSQELWIRYGSDPAFRAEVDAKFGRSVAYRLPTSGLNSSTYVQMVFLPPQAGQVCAMNPATVGILGADFDVDKIWMYFRDLEAHVSGRLAADPDAQIKDDMFLALEKTYAQADAERFKAMTTPVSPETVQQLAAAGKEKWDDATSNPNAQWNDMFQMANQRRNASISKSMVGPATMWVKVLARFGRVGAYLHGELPTVQGPGGVSETTGFNPRYQSRKSDVSLTGSRTFVKFTDGSSPVPVVGMQGGVFVPADDPQSLEYGKFQEAPRGKGGPKPEDTLISLQNYILDLSKTSDADGLGLNPDTNNVAGLMGALGYDASIIFALLTNPAVRAYVEYRALAQDSMASTSASKDPARILEGVRLVAKDRGQTSTFSAAKEDLFRRLVDEEYDEEAVGNLANYKGELFTVTVDAKKLVERGNTGFAAKDDDLDALAAFIALDRQARDVVRHNSETNLIAHGMDGAFEDRDTYIRSILEGASNPQVAKVLADDYTNGMHANWEVFHRVASMQSVDALAHRRVAMEAVGNAGLGWLARDPKMGGLLNRVMRRNLWLRIGGLSGGTDLDVQAAFGRLASELDMFRHDPRFSAFLGLFDVKGHTHREGAYIPVLEWAGGLNLKPEERDAAVRAFESMLADPLAGGFAQRLVFYTYRYHGSAGVNGSWYGVVPSSHIRAATLGVDLAEEADLEGLRYYGYNSRESVLAETEHMADEWTEAQRISAVLDRMETETDPETGERIFTPNLEALSLFFDEAGQWMVQHFPTWKGGTPPPYTKRDALGVAVNPDGSFKGLYRASYAGTVAVGVAVYEKAPPPVEVDEPVTSRLNRVLDDLTGKEGVGAELAAAMGRLFDSPTRGIGKTKVIYVDEYGAGKHGAYIPSANVVLIYEKTIADEVRKRGVPEGSTEEAEIAKFTAAVEFEELVHAATYLQIRTNKELADRWDKLYKDVKAAYDGAAETEKGGLREADFANPDELAAAFLRALAGDPRSAGLMDFLNKVTHETAGRERRGLLGNMKALFVKAFERLRSALGAVDPKAGTALEAMYDLAADTLASVPVGRHVVRSEGIKTEPSQWSDWVSKMEDYYRTEPGRKWC